MSRKMLAVAALALVALPLTAAHGQISFGLAAGASAPMGNFSQSYDVGYHAMASLSFNPPLAPIGFRIDGMFNEFNRKSPSTSKSRILSGTGSIVLSAPSIPTLSPYLIGGIGLYRQSFTSAPVGSSSPSDLGFNIGGGIKFGLAGFSAFGEVRYHLISGTNGPRFVPITFGVMF